MNRRFLLVSFPVFICFLIFLLFSFSLMAESFHNPPKSKKVEIDTCYYFLSGYGLDPIGATILNIKTIDCKCKPDSVDVVLDNELKLKYPDEYFMLEKRKVNGPFKKLNDAENEILKLRNVIK